MNILNVEHISKRYGDKTIFDDVSLGIHQGDKIGVIGVNGTGKSTLLKIIADIESPDSGEVVSKKGIDIIYLPQNPEFRHGQTILSYVLEEKNISDMKIESQAKSILTRLGIYEFEEVVDHLSGGQKKRVALAKTLVDPAHVLILDEPTNHLDNDMVLWLEEYLSNFNGVLLMVTHDRYFLDRVSNKIIEIDYTKLYEYNENYSGFLEKKAQREEMEAASYRKKQSLLRVELQWMQQGIKARGTRQRARTERFEELKNAKGPADNVQVEMDSVSSRLGKKIIELSNVSKGYDKKQLIHDFSYLFLKNDRVGFIGPNGCGKSTLMKMIIGKLKPDQGDIIVGDTVNIGYFSQENDEMNGSLRVIDYIKEVAEYIETTSGTASASQMLERFLFSSELQYTPIEKLSGGEKRRLYLLRVLMSAPNVLILDEPTNDLDIATLTILEDYLDSFQGVVITVSHDRYFLDRVVNRIFAFEDQGILKQYEGGYTDYLEKIKNNGSKTRNQKEKKEKTYKKEHEKKPKFSYKEKQEFETIDDDIENLENKIQDLENKILQNATDAGKLATFTIEKEEAEALLEEKMDRWVYLNDLAEQIENYSNQ